VRKKLFNQVRARLIRRLFLAKPTFCPALMEINALVGRRRLTVSKPVLKAQAPTVSALEATI